MNSSRAGSLLPGRRVNIIGGGPVGLLLAALFQSMEGISVRLYEKRSEYTRTRMVKLSSFLVADSVESYCDDQIDNENVQAVFNIAEIEETLSYRKYVPDDVMALIRKWIEGFCSLNSIEQELSKLIENPKNKNIERIYSNITAEQAKEILEPGEILVDCSGCKSLLRDHLAIGNISGTKDANTFNIQLEYAIVVTFLYSQSYQCNEYCKYYKNSENAHYKFIPAVDRTCYDGNTSFVSGIVKISTEEYQAMPPSFDGKWLRENFPQVAHSMDRFIDKVKLETNGEIIGDLDIVRIPLNLYRARNVTNLKWLTNGASDHSFSQAPVFLVGDSALGSPYFQSISLGIESAIFLAGLMQQKSLPITELQNHYEQYIYKQWLRVYMRSKMIKHNKDLFQRLDDPFGLLELLHIY